MSDLSALRELTLVGERLKEKYLNRVLDRGKSNMSRAKALDQMDVLRDVLEEIKQEIVRSENDE